jgi:hypothetical protein
MDLASAPSDITGWRVIPDLPTLRTDYQAAMGQQAGTYAADALRADGWRVAFDLRLDGCAGGFVCERARSDGSVQSVIWDTRQIRSVYPPRL